MAQGEGGGGQRLALIAMVGCWGWCIGRGCQGVSGGALAGQWRTHSVGASTLVSEEEGPDNQHEVEGVEGRQRGECYIG